MQKKNKNKNNIMIIIIIIILMLILIINTLPTDLIINGYLIYLHTYILTSPLISLFSNSKDK